MRVRITETPHECEVDGVRLDGLVGGTVRDVASSIGAWLVTEGYAEPEMRLGPREEDLEFSGVREDRHQANDTPRRRSTDR